jgi:hypothetical protein
MNAPEQERPIFIVGSPRSGTTLLRNLLNRHPAIAICRATDFYHYVYLRQRSFGDLSDLRNRERLTKEYLSLQRIQRMQVDLKALGDILLRDGISYPAFFACLWRYYAEVHGKRRCGEKNARHAMFTEALCEWYPGARILHIVRDPRDAVASLMRMPFAPNNAIGATRLWLSHNLAAHRSRHRPQYLGLRYERLVADPEGELKRICKFVGEEYSPDMLVPNHDSTADRPWLHRAQERVTQERVERWREELCAADVSLVEWTMGANMQVFDYQPAGRPASVAAIARGLAWGTADGIRRRVGEFPGSLYFVMQSRQLVKEETAKERFRNRFWMGEAPGGAGDTAR